MPSAAAAETACQSNEREGVSAALIPLLVNPVLTGLRSAEASKLVQVAHRCPQLTTAISSALSDQSGAAKCGCCSKAASRQSCFHGAKPPAIAMQAYLTRIAQHSKSSPVCLVMALIYLQRLAKVSEHLICEHSIHRLTITAVLLAAKLSDDRVYNNSLYARIGGISTKELNRMELDLMRRLGYRLMVPVSEIDEQLAVLGVALPDSLAPQQKPRHGQKRAGHAHSPSVELPSKAVEVFSSQSHLAAPKLACASSDARPQFLEPSAAVPVKVA